MMFTFANEEWKVSLKSNVLFEHRIPAVSSVS